jgi:hypothetical protein
MLFSTWMIYGAEFARGEVGGARLELATSYL